MKGRHTVIVRNKRVLFTLELERNITVLRGDSATGKTTMVGMLRDYEELGNQSGVSVESDYPCRILSGMQWEERLHTISNSIVFVDEGNSFVSSQAFAEAIKRTNNYYVLVTRESLYQLPYSVESVLELRKVTSRSSNNIKCTYNKTYPYYKTVSRIEEQIDGFQRILTEDSRAGHQFFSRVAEDHMIKCDSAGGKSNIYKNLASEHNTRTLVIADGAAFGADMEKVHRFCEMNHEQTVLYLPESFEWLILRAGVLRSTELEEILRDPGKYIDSERIFSWEQYFTDLLVNLSKQRDYTRYSKDYLAPFYFQMENVQKIIAAMSKE